MDWDRVVDSACDAHFGQAARITSSLLSDTNRVNVIDVAGVGAFVRRYDFLYSLKSPVILRRMRAPELISFVKVPQFDAENGCLYSVHPGSSSPTMV